MHKRLGIWGRILGSADTNITGWKAGNLLGSDKVFGQVVNCCPLESRPNVDWSCRSRGSSRKKTQNVGVGWLSFAVFSKVLEKWNVLFSLLTLVDYRDRENILLSKEVSATFFFSLFIVVQFTYEQECVKYICTASGEYICNYHPRKETECCQHPRSSMCHSLITFPYRSSEGIIILIIRTINTLAFVYNLFSYGLRL